MCRIRLILNTSNMASIVLARSNNIAARKAPWKGRTSRIDILLLGFYFQVDTGATWIHHRILPGWGNTDQNEVSQTTSSWIVMFTDIDPTDCWMVNSDLDFGVENFKLAGWPWQWRAAKIHAGLIRAWLSHTGKLECSSSMIFASSDSSLIGPPSPP